MSNFNAAFNSFCQGAAAFGRSVAQGAQGAGNAIGKGVQDTGNAIGKGFHDTGAAIAKPFVDTYTGAANEVEKAKQSVLSLQKLNGFQTMSSTLDQASGAASK